MLVAYVLNVNHVDQKILHFVILYDKTKQKTH
jgi:hypothetical protein